MKALRLTLLAVVVVTVLAYFYEGFFGSLSVCSKCGRTKNSSRTYWIPSTTVKETALSRFCDELAGGAEHDHDWLFASGGGGEITCAIGEGRYLYPALRQEEPIQALRQIRQRRGDDAAKLWLGRLLDPKMSDEARISLSLLILDSPEFDTAYEEAEEDFTAASAWETR